MCAWTLDRFVSKRNFDPAQMLDQNQDDVKCIDAHTSTAAKFGFEGLTNAVRAYEEYDSQRFWSRPEPKFLTDIVKFL